MAKSWARKNGELTPRRHKQKKAYMDCSSGKVLKFGDAVANVRPSVVPRELGAVGRHALPGPLHAKEIHGGKSVKL